MVLVGAGIRREMLELRNPMGTWLVAMIPAIERSEIRRRYNNLIPQFIWFLANIRLYKKIWPTYFLGQKSFHVEIHPWIHSCQLHREKLQQKKNAERVMRVSLQSRYNNGGLRLIWIYLNLTLQGLHIVYNFVQHNCFPSHLKWKFKPNSVLTFALKIDLSNKNKIIA